MILISHRGNLNGKNEKFENHPDYILDAKDKGFEVEIDVWFKENNFYLGHDKAQYKIDQNFLEDEKFWCHAKSSETLYELSKINCHYFWHAPCLGGSTHGHSPPPTHFQTQRDINISSRIANRYTRIFDAGLQILGYRASSVCSVLITWSGWECGLL